MTFHLRLISSEIDLDLKVKSTTPMAAPLATSGKGRVISMDIARSSFFMLTPDVRNYLRTPL